MRKQVPSYGAPHITPYPSTCISGGFKSPPRASLVDAGPACPHSHWEGGVQAGDPLAVTRKGREKSCWGPWSLPLEPYRPGCVSKSPQTGHPHMMQLPHCPTAPHTSPHATHRALARRCAVRGSVRVGM
eukprot:5511885-Prymnesium_polylepis.1